MLGSQHNPGLFLCHTTGRFQLFKSLTSIIKILSQNYNPKQYVSTQKTPNSQWKFTLGSFDSISDTFSHKALVSRVAAVFLDVGKIPAARII